MIYCSIILLLQINKIRCRNVDSKYIIECYTDIKSNRYKD